MLRLVLISLLCLGTSVLNAQTTPKKQPKTTTKPKPAPAPAPAPEPAPPQNLCEMCTQRINKPRELGAGTGYLMSCMHPDENAMCGLVAIESYTFSRIGKSKSGAQASTPPVSVEMFTDALLVGQGKYLFYTFQEWDIFSISDIVAKNLNGDIVRLKGFSFKLTSKNQVSSLLRLKNRWIELANVLPEMKNLDKDKVKIESFLVNGVAKTEKGFDANLIGDDAAISKVKASYMGKPLQVADFLWKWE